MQAAMADERPQRSPLEERIFACLERDDLHGAATEAIQGYGRQILLYLTAVLRDQETAREVFSQFAEDLWKGLAGFRGESSLKTWAHRVAWHAAQRHLRDPFRRRGRRLETAEISRIAERVHSNTAIYLKSSVKRGMSNLRDLLRPEERTLLILRIDRGMSWEEVAEVMAEPDEKLEPVVLRNRFQRLKAKLRKLAETHGVGEKSKA